jgi:hypothetical protein
VANKIWVFLNNKGDAVSSETASVWVWRTEEQNGLSHKSFPIEQSEKKFLSKEDEIWNKLSLETF